MLCRIKEGNSFGLEILNRFSRLVSPLSSLICDLLTLNCLARNLIKCWLALPSTGGAAMRTLMLFPMTSQNSSLLALGCAFTRKNRFSFFHS